MRKPKVYFGLTLRYLFHGIFMWNEFKGFTQTKAGKIQNNDLIGIFLFKFRFKLPYYYDTGMGK